MHDVPDTDDADAAAERYWPEAYKEIIRSRLSRIVSARFQEDEAFSGVYERGYKDRFDSYERFVNRLAEMIVIGAENGVDDVLEEVYDAFRRSKPLPGKRLYGRYFWPEPFDEALKETLHQAVFDDFSDYHTCSYPSSPRSLE